MFGMEIFFLPDKKRSFPAWFILKLVELNGKHAVHYGAVTKPYGFLIMLHCQYSLKNTRTQNMLTLGVYYYFLEILFGTVQS